MKCNWLRFPYQWKWEQSEEEWCINANEGLLRRVILCYLCRTAEIWFQRFGTRGRAIIALPSPTAVAGVCSKPWPRSMAASGPSQLQLPQASSSPGLRGCPAWSCVETFWRWWWSTCSPHRSSPRGFSCPPAARGLSGCTGTSLHIN